MKVKYPRTPHLPFSEGNTADDIVLTSLDQFKNRTVVVTEKLDGENTTLYKEGFHARSIDSQSHPSQSWVKNYHAHIKHFIPEGWRICGENMYAKHSIHYTNLRSYFYGFSIWDENNECLPWDLTMDFFRELNITSVPVLYLGVFDKALIETIIRLLDLEKQEGIVVRRFDSFKYEEFSDSVAKWVRKSHVRTSTHWKNEPLIANRIGG